jgi:hypothetical protein
LSWLQSFRNNGGGWLECSKIYSSNIRMNAWMNDSLNISWCVKLSLIASIGFCNTWLYTFTRERERECFLVVHMRITAMWNTAIAWIWLDSCNISARYYNLRSTLVVHPKHYCFEIQSRYYSFHYSKF